VLPALIRKFHTAKKNNEPEVVMWGTGTPLREFMHADDLAAACLFLMEHHDQPGHVNVGTGEEVSILELAQLIARVVGYEGEITHDLSKPDGTPRKLMDVHKLHEMGYRHGIDLTDGVEAVYRELKSQDWY
jgi:GDP-L-fucose synthase